MSDHTNRQDPRWLGGIFLAVGLLFLGVSGWFAERRLAVINSWPTVEAEVVHSEVTRYEDSEGSTLYKATFRFRYTVAGREFLTDTDNGYGTSFRSWMQKKVDRFAPGTHHRIHYNAADPGEIEYNAGYNFEFFGIPLFCTGMGLIFGLVGVGALRRPSADRCPSCSQSITPGQPCCPNCGLPLSSA